DRADLVEHGQSSDGAGCSRLNCRLIATPLELSARVRVDAAHGLAHLAAGAQRFADFAPYGGGPLPQTRQAGVGLLDEAQQVDEIGRIDVRLHRRAQALKLFARRVGPGADILDL